MELTYQDVSGFAQSWGLVFLVLVFVGAILYAFLPSNKKKYEQASISLLEEE